LLFVKRKREKKEEGRGKVLIFVVVVHFAIVGSFGGKRKREKKEEEKGKERLLFI